MPLAPALLIPFAEAVGLSIAGLGAIEIGKKVQDFIEDNPEISMDILTSLKQSLSMTAPGIGGIFMNEEDSGDDDKKDTRSKKEIILEGLRKAREGKGNYSSPDATGSAVSAQGNIIRGLEDAGKIKKGPDPNYDPDKKYKGYKKFYEKADGGAIGIEVLFEEKKDGGRIGFANGGDNIINKDLVTLYRGQPMFGPSRYLQLANQGTPSIMGGSTQGLTTAQLSKLAGQYYTTDLPVAEKYAGKTGKILSTQVPSNYVNESGRFNRFQNKVTGLPSGNYTNAGVTGNSYLVPKSTLKNYPSKIDIGKTISNYMGNLDYPGKVIKAGYDLGHYGPGGVLKEIGSEGLGFLKNNAMKALTFAGSLPFQTALATLYPTPANADEVNMKPEDFAALNSRTNVQGMDLEMDPGARINPDIQPQQNIFQRAGDVFSSIKDNIPNFGILGLLNNLDQFDNLPIEDRQFILDQAGGNRPSKDPFGINRRSAFGNYADYVRNQGILAPGKRGEYYRSLNIPGLDTAMKETVAREQIAKRAYEKQIRDAADAASRNAARARSITAGYGGSDDSRGATGPTASGAGMGVGGGYASDYGFAKGGLATMFVEKR